MEDFCSVCGEPVEDYISDWVLHEPLCLNCYFENKNKEISD